MTFRFESRIGVRKIHMIAGRKSKTFHFVVRSSHRKKTGTMQITAMTPNRSLNRGWGSIRYLSCETPVEPKPPAPRSVSSGR